MHTRSEPNVLFEPSDDVDPNAATVKEAGRLSHPLAVRVVSLASRRKSAVRKVSMPEWPEPVRGAPNPFLRCALFAAVQGKHRRVFKKRTLLASTRDIAIKLQGVQLDQSDLDVWLQILHLSRKQLPGMPVTFSAYSLLKALNRDRGKGQYQWLSDSMARLGGALVELTFQGRHTFGDHLLRYYRDEDTQRYVVELTAEMCRLFDGGYSHLEWQERQLLKRKPLTLWLHGYLSSHTDPYPIKVATLHKLSGSTAQNLRHFKARLQRALDDLTDLELLGKSEITPEGLLVINWQRPQGVYLPRESHTQQSNSPRREL